MVWPNSRWWDTAQHCDAIGIGHIGVSSSMSRIRTGAANPEWPESKYMAVRDWGNFKMPVRATGPYERSGCVTCILAGSPVPETLPVTYR